ncbi:pesticidial crystal protein cry4BA [Bacillus paranthracis]|uniref:Cry28Aa2-like protein n=2 Tax=Bacillus cereus group TaxID=86661 RepID=A0A6F7TLP9_BACTU|nr:hypothetical protein [Bacillus paranthracis]ADY24720.1 pesticidial crystal protein cry4BA [Bacillus thuringiensis serovar finitimus YBT-020]AEH76816.1 Cry28Aa2-like protein [Bacillus thuringiensis]MED1395033.1 pesticidial crystal protein cry4BA [Bacillus paranthracis]OTX77476.1 pesticidial crystal protein cry4BA [Bacillus thuringiensis serovar finitimus]
MNYTPSKNTNGGFSNNENWIGSPNIEYITGNPIYKGLCIHLKGSTFPTYLYQKIDESKLKPYTRYQIRGFAESSQDLDLDLIRYGASHITMNAPDNLKILTPPCEELNSRFDTSCDVFDRCTQSIYVDSAANICSDQIDGDPHAFSLHIDTGTVDSNENLGIWVAFKVSILDGYATLGNLELIEVGPLSGESLAQVQRQEQHWKQLIAKERETTVKLYAAAKQAINRLFEDSQDTKLRFDTELFNILSTYQLIYKIQDVYNSCLSAIPGLNYELFMELKNRIQTAIDLYEARNTPQNGEFRNRLTGWETTANVEVKEVEGEGAFVLILSNWNASVSQTVSVQKDHGYVLRVTAKKEGIGDGYVTILDCANHVDTLTFGACDAGSDVSSNELAGYVTKTLEIYPDTDQISIEIGETEGTFYIESIDLIRMEG